MNGDIQRAAVAGLIEAMGRIERGCQFPADDVQRTIRDVARAALARIGTTT